MTALLLFGCGDDGGGTGDESSSTGTGTDDTNTATITDTATATNTATATATNTATATATDATTESSGPGESTAPADSSDSGTDTGSTTDASSGTDSGESDTSGTTGIGTDDAYPACDLDADPPCPKGFDECVDIDNLMVNWCTVNCESADECPVPATGNATVECAGPGGDQCALSCADDETCPDGMECVELVFGIVRCVWPY